MTAERRAAKMGVDAVLDDVVVECARQIVLHGVQNPPDFDPQCHLAPEFVPAYYGLPTEDDAKARCQGSFASGHGSWGDILVEEVAEAFSAPSLPQLREELVQVAAVAASWIAAIDRRELAE